MRKAMIVMIAILACLPSTLTVQALPGSSVETTYYSDATYTDIVGSRIIGCNGVSYISGVRTQWYDRYSESCESGSYACYRCYEDQNGIMHCDELC